MNVAEFNTELNKLTTRAVQEGLCRGKMTAVEFIGVLKLNEIQSEAIVMGLLAAQAQKQQPLIHLPPSNGSRLPGPPG